MPLLKLPAGEQGLGFAADEVQALRCNLKRNQGLVTEIQAETIEVVAAMKLAIEQVAEVPRLVDAVLSSSLNYKLMLLVTRLAILLRRSPRQPSPNPKF